MKKCLVLKVTCRSRAAKNEICYLKHSVSYVLLSSKLRLGPRTVGTAVAQCLRCCATNRKVAGSIPASVSVFFIDLKFFRSHYRPGVDSASNRNEYQEHFLGVKAAGA